MRIRILTLIVVCVLAFSSYQLLEERCWLWTCPPPRSFSILEIRMPTEIFPDIVQVAPTHLMSEYDGALEAATTTVFWAEGDDIYRAGLNIWRFGTAWRASQFMDKFAQVRLRGNYVDEIDLARQALQANEARVNCGFSEFNDGYKCHFDARYEEFYISAYSYISDEVTKKSFAELIVSIDNRLMQLVVGGT